MYDINGLQVTTFASPITIQITSFVTTATEISTDVYQFSLSSNSEYLLSEPPIPPICLVKGTQILTPTGYTRIETLRNGDLVTTESKAVRIQNIYALHYEKTNKSTAPYTIYRNAFSTNCPPNDIQVSGRHVIQLRPGLWEIPEEAAKENSKVVQSKPGDSVTYYHIELPDYAKDNLIANGCVVESLNTGETYKETYAWDEKEKGYKRILVKKSSSLKLTA